MSMPELDEVSPLTLNRLSFYLRCLRHLQEQEIRRISSQELARRYHLSATQIRKDLAQFGEFGIRGVGYEVEVLAEHLNALLGLDRRHAMVIVGMGNLGCALARYLGFNYGECLAEVGPRRRPVRPLRLFPGLAWNLSASRPECREIEEIPRLCLAVRPSIRVGEELLGVAIRNRETVHGRPRRSYARIEV